MAKLKEAVIVAYGRSPVGRAIKGSLRNVHPVDLGAEVLQGVLNRIPELDPKMIEDMTVGCSIPEGGTGYNIARLVGFRAGLPYTCAAQTVNRFCSSGLQAISIAASEIMTGQADIVIAGGIESMSFNGNGADKVIFNPWLQENYPDAYISMGITAENVADMWNISREELDAMALESHRRAAAAQDAGKFDDEIIPVNWIDDEGNIGVFAKDEGIRRNTTMEGLAKLKTVFKENGKVTAASSSQMSDGAAFLVMMSEEKAEELGIEPIAKFRGFSVAGVNPNIMGIGPIKAIPKVMAQTGLNLEQMDVIELNEAFASQAIACIRDLGMDSKKVNPNGGAMALGHPLGATGVILTCKAISELKRTGGKYGLISMCIGGGMGAAGIIEMI